MKRYGKFGLLALVIGLLSVPARAATVSCATWDEVKNALKAGNNAKLTADITADSYLTLEGTMSVTLDLNGKTISYSSTDSLIYINGSTLTITGSGTLNGNNVNRRAGLLYMRDPPTSTKGGTLILEGGTICNCKGENGPAIYILKGDLFIRGGTIKECTAEKYGGAIFFNDYNSSGKFEMSGGNISKCTAKIHGGAVFLDRSSAKLSSGTISGCTAQCGGAIYGVDDVTMSGGIIESCSATEDGGAIYTEGAVTLSGGMIKSCTASANGGAVYSAGESSSVTLSGGMVESCTATSGNGGAIYLNGAPFTMSSGIINSCSAQNGGAVAATGSSAKLAMTGGAITGSSAKTSGGGVYITASGQFELKGGEISNCSAPDYGGIFADGAKFIMRGGVVKSNSATGSVGYYGVGGGAAARNRGSIEVYDGIFRGNKAAWGGAIEGWSKSHVTIKGGLFVDNSATVGKENNFYCDGRLTVSGGVFNNGLDSDVIAFPSGYGQQTGIAYIFVGKDLALVGDTIQSGTLTFDPLSETYKNLGLIDTDITTVTQNGSSWVVASTEDPTTYKECSTWAALKEALIGGWNAKLMCDITQDSDTAYLESKRSQTLNLNGHTLKRKSGYYLVCPKTGNTLTVKGGGMLDGKANNNYLDTSTGGGCVYVNGGTFILKNGTLTGLHKNGGGGVGIFAGGTFEMRGGTLKNCISKNGGAVFVDTDSFFVMRGGVIDSCKAEYNGGGEGGGVYSKGSVTITGGKIVSCAANGSASRTGNGGALTITDSSATVSGVELRGNTANRYGGAVEIHTGTATFSSCTISGNKCQYAGGGIEVDTSQIVLNDCVVSYNSVTTSDSSWEYSGGGVHVMSANGSSSCVMNGGTISGNSARFGGGVGLYKGATFQMTDGRICGNTAKSEDGGGIAIEENGLAILSGGEVSGNTAKRDDGGICASGEFQMTGGVIKNNAVQSGTDAAIRFWHNHSRTITAGVILGGVYVDSNAAGTVCVTGGVFSADVGGYLAPDWMQYECNGLNVVARDIPSSTAGAFATKDNKVYAGIFAFNIRDDIYADHGITIEKSRFVNRTAEGYWRVMGPPAVTINGAPLNDGSGTGWSLDSGVVTISKGNYGYTIAGEDYGSELGIVVSASGTTVTLSDLLLLRGAATRPPVRYASAATSSKLVLSGENRLWCMADEPALRIDVGASVALSGDGSLAAAGVTTNSGERCFSVAGALTMTSGTITGYETAQDGAAVSVEAGGSFGWSAGTITDCLGRNGGAVYSEGAVTLADLVVTGNTATENGGAVYSAGTLKVDRCRFEENKATSGAGGAIYALPGSSTTMKLCSFRKNTGAGGGGAFAGGGFSVVNATVIENTSKDNGGGYRHEGGSGELVNVTFRANNAKGSYGGGIAVEDGTLSLANVLSQGNTGSGWPDACDICVVGGSLLAKGVLASKANFSGDSTCYVNGKETWSLVFANGAGEELVPVGTTEQYVERLANTSNNRALKGYSGSSVHQDMTGRTFDECQIGSYWQTFDRPSLTVESLSDTASTQDGFVTLRDVLVGIVDGNADYRALAEDGVYKIKFLPSLAGELVMKAAQYDIANVPGEIVEVDGKVDSGRVTIRGYNVTGTTTVRTNAYRAFSVHAGNTLRLKNLDLNGNVASTASRLHFAESKDGGAIANRGRLEVEDCSFANCSAGDKYANPVGFGGAIANGPNGVSGATATLARCTFADCRAAQGGAIYNYAGNSVTLTDCTLESNRAGGGSAILVATGGAIRNEKDAALAYDGCTFTDNTSVLDGVEVPSDINTNVLASPVVAVTVAKGVMSLALSAKAAPSLTAASTDEPVIDLSGEATMEDGSPAVAVKPANVRPYLYYGLGRADSPGGAYTVSEWVQADAQGNLPAALVAPKAGDSGYYRVEVSLSGK